MRLWLATAAVNGFIAVSCGALAAHFLQDRLDKKHFDIWEVAARYQMYHALALLGVALLRSHAPTLFDLAGWAFLVGIVLFCGSLYALSLTGIGFLGAITPFGGVAFLAGWLCLAWGVSRG